MSGVMGGPGRVDVRRSGPIGERGIGLRNRAISQPYANERRESSLAASTKRRSASERCARLG